MKANVNEKEGGFVVYLCAEDLVDAALLVRLGASYVASFCCTTYAHEQRGFECYLEIGKKKNYVGVVPKIQ